MSRPPLSLLSAVSSCHGKGALSTFLIIGALRVASTMKFAHTTCAIALSLSMQTDTMLLCTITDKKQVRLSGVLSLIFTGIYNIIHVLPGSDYHFGIQTASSLPSVPKLLHLISL